MSLNSVAGFEGEKGRAPTGEILFSKTCQNCFSLKIRCDRTLRKDICDRCTRLGKACVFRPARRRDNSAKRDSRIQALEAQVKNLLQTQDPAQTTQQPLPEQATPLPPLPPLSEASSLPAEGDVVDEDILTIERADTLVEMYKSEMMPHFPFVIVSPQETGRGLRRAKPFLFLAMMTVASFHDLPAQEQLSNRFKIMAVDKVLHGGNDCLQLEYLQGILILLAWNQYFDQSKHFTQYLQLAISIAVDMRLDRKPIRRAPQSVNNKRDPLREGDPGTPTWGPEEQRASAGLFYLSSTVSKLLDKLNVFPCTRYIEEGCLSLGQKAEYRTDQDLYHVIRLQKIIESIESVDGEPSSDAEAQATFLRVRAELEGFRVFLSADNSDSQLLFMQFHTAKLFLYQIAFFERNLQQSPLLHLNILCEGLESAKSFLDLFLWLAPKSEMALTNAEWVQLSFGATQAAKFAIVSKEPNVEPQTRDLRRKLNMDHVFRHLTLRIGALVGRAGADKQKDIFFYYERRTQKIQRWYENMTRAIRSESPEPQRSANLHASVSPPQRSPPQHSPAGRQYASSVSSHLSHQHGQPQVPLAGHTYQQSLPQQITYSNGPSPVPTDTLQTPANVGMAPLDAYVSYSPGPAIAFTDLMSAPGWDTMFTVPMEDTSWLLDMPQSYEGLESVSPPSDAGWRDPGNL